MPEEGADLEEAIHLIHSVTERHLHVMNCFDLAKIRMIMCSTIIISKSCGGEQDIDAQERFCKKQNNLYKCRLDSNKYQHFVKVERGTQCDKKQ